MTQPAKLPETIDETLALLERGRYVAGREFATILLLALKLGRPLLLEGATGVGKTELASVLAQGLGRRLLRLQCYEGLDAAAAVYEWNYAAQMLAIRMAEATSGDADNLATDLFSDRFLIERPLLQALRADEAGAPVLLIDEIDQADPPFEAYLLEILSDFQVSIPEAGTRIAIERPIVIITSNSTRDVHDALRRRCVFHHVTWPDAEGEKAILGARLPGAPEALSGQIEAFVGDLRTRLEGREPPPREESKWASSLVEMDRFELEPDRLNKTFNLYFRYRRELADAEGKEIAKILARAQAELAGLEGP